MRRRDLKGVATGILSSFNSRNNDLSGYWGIGVICLHAQQLNLDTFVLDLLYQTVEPNNEYVCLAAEEHHRKLVRRLRKFGIPLSRLKSAFLTIYFTSAPEPKPYNFLSMHGGLYNYVCTLEITNDFGTQKSVEVSGICWPHDPKKESRSTRDNDFSRVP